MGTNSVGATSPWGETGIIHFTPAFSVTCIGNLIPRVFVTLPVPLDKGNKGSGNGIAFAQIVCAHPQ